MTTSSYAYVPWQAEWEDIEYYANQEDAYNRIIRCGLHMLKQAINHSQNAYDHHKDDSYDGVLHYYTSCSTNNPTNQLRLTSTYRVSGLKKCIDHELPENIEGAEKIMAIKAIISNFMQNPMLIYSTVHQKC